MQEALLKSQDTISPIWFAHIPHPITTGLTRLAKKDPSLPTTIPSYHFVLPTPGNGLLGHKLHDFYGLWGEADEPTAPWPPPWPPLPAPRLLQPPRPGASCASSPSSRSLPRAGRPASAARCRPPTRRARQAADVPHGRALRAAQHPAPQRLAGRAAAHGGQGGSGGSARSSSRGRSSARSACGPRRLPRCADWQRPPRPGAAAIGPRRLRARAVWHSG